MHFFLFFEIMCHLQVCLEICNHLEIQLFKIPYPPSGSSKTMTSGSAVSENSQDRNGLNAASSYQSQSPFQQQHKRQTRSSKRQVAVQ